MERSISPSQKVSPTTSPHHGTATDQLFRNRYINRRQEGKIWKEDFQKAYQKVETTMDSVLHGWLQNPMDGMYALHYAWYNRD